MVREHTGRLLVGNGTFLKQPPIIVVLFPVQEIPTVLKVCILKKEMPMYAVMSKFVYVCVCVSMDARVNRYYCLIGKHLTHR